MMKSYIVACRSFRWLINNDYDPVTKIEWLEEAPCNDPIKGWISQDSLQKGVAQFLCDISPTDVFGITDNSDEISVYYRRQVYN